MAKRPCKCKYCSESITNDVEYQIIKSGKKLFFCCEKHYLLYMEQLEEITRDNEEWKKLYEYIKNEILCLGFNYKLPPCLITSLKALRGGSTCELGEGWVNLKGCGYPYPVILETFIEQCDYIKYCLKTKNFKNDTQMTNYMLAIIRNNVNRVYKKWQAEQEARERSCEFDHMDSINFNVIKNTPINEQINYGILRFIDKEDL